MTKKNIRTQYQVLSEVMVNLASGFFGYVLLSSFASLDTWVLVRSFIFGFVFYYFAVKMRDRI